AEALEILKTKRKGSYLVIQMDPAYEPPAVETKQVFGVTFEQRRNDVKIDEHIFDDIVTKNHDLPESAKRDLLIATITLKYTQSNSVCYAYDGQAIGIGAGQQSRVHCTRLAGDKADRWFLRQSPQVLGLPFKDDVRRPDRDNAIDVYIGEEWEDLLETDDWKRVFTEKPPVFTREEKKAWLQKETGVSLGSDAFFPFGDNIERAHKSGVTYVAQTGGSIRDDNVIETADKYNMTMAMTHIRLFHH
ncbi:phosphoribosylaminoimidazolecarboxamide formyltransferase, partial [Mitsuokella jalaludinii]|uniref:phosphoribosylaminoimidazolecarboxamide formyltransferase n=1 Tax=Mitsuokella jalaludinii TaxID=187979 RepID=UPI002A91A1D2